MPKKPKWVRCPEGCYRGYVVPMADIQKHEGVIDGCFGGHWYDNYPTCKKCSGRGQINMRAKKSGAT